jgi:peptide-methionine (S)-S-oxide reductase
LSVSFVLDGAANYLPGLHNVVRGLAVGEALEGVSIDAGYGSHDPALVKEGISYQRLLQVSKRAEIRVGQSIRLRNAGNSDAVDFAVTRISDNGSDRSVTLDANPPLAGSSYACSLKVLRIDQCPPSLTFHYTASPNLSRFDVTTFALGCFWGAELAFTRVPGVVGTQVGYMVTPSSSSPGHQTEVVQVIFDTAVVSYESLLQVAWSRLHPHVSKSKLADGNTTDHTVNDSFALDGDDENSSTLANLFDTSDDEPGSRHHYRHGFFYHSPAQREMAQTFLRQYVTWAARDQDPVIRPMLGRFEPAEEYHQQYLLKGGQSAKKNAKDPIRCYG